MVNDQDKDPPLLWKPELKASWLLTLKGIGMERWVVSHEAVAQLPMAIITHSSSNCSEEQ